jgi:hypothetical protein
MVSLLLVLAISSGLVGGKAPDPNPASLASLKKEIIKPRPSSARLSLPDHVLRFTSSTMIAADWLMTIDGLRKGYSESNPLLGEHPPLGKANLMIGAGLLANTFVVPMIKDSQLRRGIWAAMILIEFHALRANSSAGLRLNFQL